MFGKKKEIPVYIFTGFLESGKTQFIIETLKEGQFKDGNRTLYIICEEGVEEVSRELLDENMFETAVVENEEDVSFDSFMKLDLDHDPDRVVIEYNGTWDPDRVIEALPEHWLLAEGICTIDASTYQDYLANMNMHHRCFHLPGLSGKYEADDDEAVHLCGSGHIQQMRSFPGSSGL